MVSATLDQAALVGALAGDIVLCSLARHLTVTVPLSTQVDTWVPRNIMLGVTGIISRGEKYFGSLHASETGLQPGSYLELTFT